MPQNTDRGDTDKDFGNMNTYRAVLWVKIENESSKSLFVFNSHYPLNGNSKTRFECAKLEMNKIKEIAGNSKWISAGDRNLILHKDDNEIRMIMRFSILKQLIKSLSVGVVRIYEILESILALALPSLDLLMMSIKMR